MLLSFHSSLFHYWNFFRIYDPVLLGPKESIFESELVFYPLEVNISPLCSLVLLVCHYSRVRFFYFNDHFIFVIRAIFLSLCRIPWSSVVGVLLGHIYYFLRDVIPVVYRARRKPVPHYTKAPTWLYHCDFHFIL